MEHGTATGDAAAVEFALGPILRISLSGGLFAVSLLNIRRPKIHKRLELPATISLMPTVVGYSLVAWERVEANAWMNVQFRRTTGAQSQTVIVEKDGRYSVLLHAAE